MSAIIDLGKLGFYFRGDWQTSAAPAYTRNDAVRHKNSLWLARDLPGANEEPAIGSAWGLGVQGYESHVYDLSITASGNWTAPYSGNYLVEVLGGGGAGGGLASCYGAGGGGASGGYMSKIINLPAGHIAPCTIGAGGIGAIGAVGGNGGDTSLGAHITAPGGCGGMGQNLGATFITGNIYFLLGGLAKEGGQAGRSAASGNNSLTSSTSPSRMYNARGGNSPYGYSPQPALASGSSGTDGGNGIGFGAGGNGGCNQAVNMSCKGGNGAPGLIKITYLGA